LQTTTRCHILKLKCTKFDFGWGCAPHLSGELTVLPQTILAGFKGPTFKEKGGGEGRGKGGEGKG